MSGTNNGYSGGVLTNPPANYCDGGQKGAMWILQYEAFISHKKLGHVLDAGFDATLLAKESTPLVTGTNDDAIKAKEDNNSSMAILTMSMKTPEMLNMIMLEKKQDTDWSTGKYSEVYKKIKKQFAPDDKVAEMDMEDDLQKIKPQKTSVPKKLLDDIAAVEV